MMLNLSSLLAPQVPLVEMKLSLRLRHCWMWYCLRIRLKKRVKILRWLILELISYHIVWISYIIFFYYQSINVAVNDQICVRPGDVIGIHYTEVEDVDGVMPYQQSGRRPTRNNLDLSALVNEPTGDNDLPLHTSMPATTTDFKRVPALQPILTTSKSKRPYIWSSASFLVRLCIHHPACWWPNNVSCDTQRVQEIKIHHMNFTLGRHFGSVLLGCFTAYHW